MVNQIEFKDCSLSGKAAVSSAHQLVCKAFQDWGFDCGISPFSYPEHAASIALQQALVDFLVAANQHVDVSAL